MKPLSWTAYVSCAVLATTSLTLLIISDVADRRDFGRWGLTSALGAVIVGAIIVADRFSQRVYHAGLVEAERRMEEIERMFGDEGGRVVEAFHEQTEEIATAVCTAVVRTMHHSGATPLKR